MWEVINSSLLPFFKLQAPKNSRDTEHSHWWNSKASTCPVCGRPRECPGWVEGRNEPSSREKRHITKSWEAPGFSKESEPRQKGKIGRWGKKKKQIPKLFRLQKTIEKQNKNHVLVTVNQRQSASVRSRSASKGDFQQVSRRSKKTTVSFVFGTEYA